MHVHIAIHPSPRYPPRPKHGMRIITSSAKAVDIISHVTFFYVVIQPKTWDMIYKYIIIYIYIYI